jgi:RNA polymerase sigma factor (sigma-70 family)
MPPTDQAPRTRASLILRLRNPDDLRAWQEFVEIYQPVIQALACKRGLQRADADDITQEVLARVAKSIDAWDPDPKKGSFRAWLATITRNLAIQFFRESGRRPKTGIESQIGRLLDDSSKGSVDDREFDLERERQLFLWAARKVRPRFEPKTWQAFWLTAVDGEKVAIVAEQLSTTKAQVYVARSRVMSLLKQTVEKTDFDTAVDGGRDG